MPDIRKLRATVSKLENLLKESAAEKRSLYYQIESWKQDIPEVNLSWLTPDCIQKNICLFAVFVGKKIKVSVEVFAWYDNPSPRQRRFISIIVGQAREDKTQKIKTLLARAWIKAEGLTKADLTGVVTL